MIDDTTTGIALARAYHRRIVGPLLASRFPSLPYAAGRLGPGSDVLGLDDARSRDHDWGLRLQVFVAEDAIGEVSACLDQALPDTFDGLPTQFALTGETRPRHHVEVSSVRQFLLSRLGFDPRAGVSASDWLSLTGQSVLEVVSGPVFVDADGELGRARQALDWYPDDLWRYVLACDWARLSQELPLMGRAAELGDDAGSRVIGARLTQVAMHLSFMLERRWPPYAKWFGTLFASLPRAGELQPHVHTVFAADAGSRQRGIAVLLERLLTQQNELGLTDVAQATVPFWDRPFLHPDPAIVAQLLAPIADERVRRLPPGRGSIEQRTDNPAILTDPQARRRTIHADET